MMYKVNYKTKFMNNSKREKMEYQLHIRKFTFNFNFNIPNNKMLGPERITSEFNQSL